MNEAIPVTSAAFDASTREGAALVDFWAEWCGPCRLAGPILEEVARERAGRLRVLKVNVDEEPYLAARYGVRSIPTLVLLRSGIEVRRFIGVVPKERLLQEIDPYLPAPEPPAEAAG